MHNLQLTEDQVLIVDTVRRFAQESVVPHVLAKDEHREFAAAEFDGLAQLGLFGLPVPEARGGAGMGLLPLAAVCEDLAAASGSVARLLLEQVQCALALAHGGAGPVDELVAGSKRAAFLGPEHAARLEAGKLTVAAELVPGAAAADLLVVAAQQGDQRVLCVVEAAAAERTPLASLGFASAGPARVRIAALAAEPVAAGPLAAAAILQARLAAWIGGAGLAVGLGAAAVQAAHRHAGERIAFGKPLLAQQAVQRKLVESRRGVDAARHLAWHAARLADGGEDAETAAMAARIAAVDAAVLASDEAVQILGGYGYTVEYHVERHYRDAKTLEVLDGGSEGLRLRLAALQFA